MKAVYKIVMLVTLAASINLSFAQETKIRYFGQPSIQRQMAIRPVSDGGVLQHRDAGVQLKGENITSVRFFYKVLLGNGVGYYGSNDKGDNHIATTVQIRAEPVEGTS